MIWALDRKTENYGHPLENPQVVVTTQQNTNKTHAYIRLLSYRPTNDKATNIWNSTVDPNVTNSNYGPTLERASNNKSSDKQNQRKLTASVEQTQTKC